jgi:hypothetical protein
LQIELMNTMRKGGVSPSRCWRARKESLPCRCILDTMDTFNLERGDGEFGRVRSRQRQLASLSPDPAM